MPFRKLGSFINNFILDLTLISSRYLNQNEYEFIKQLYEEIDLFQQQSESINCVLVYPPLRSKLRYLLHELTQQYFGHTFKSISIGKEGNRKPIIYFKQMSNENVETDHQMNDGLSDCHASHSKCDNQYNKTVSVRHKRPDMKLYVPPKAKTATNSVVPEHTEHNEHTDHTEHIHNSLTIDNSTIDSLSELEITDSSHKIECKTSDIYSESVICQKLSNKTTNDDNGCDEECSWDALFDENGDCIDPQFIEHVNNTLSVNDSELKLKKSKIDYYSYNFTAREPDITDNEFGHVLEVYDFASELKTQDIIAALSVFNCCRDFDIKWVDDTHALVIFSNHNTASDALKSIYPNIKLRPLSIGTKDSKIKARKCSEFLKPYKQRPETSASLARRLVTGALGLKVKQSPEERAAERKKLQLAKERKRQTIKQGQDIWDGNVQ